MRLFVKLAAEIEMLISQRLLCRYHINTIQTVRPICIFPRQEMQHSQSESQSTLQRDCFSKMASKILAKGVAYGQSRKTEIFKDGG
jgi:hypothetical protein